MRIRVLGCSGGVGAGLRTTSFLVDDDILIDAGSGVGDLTVGELCGIRHVFITHSHMDHVAFLPLLIDTIFDRATGPVTVHARSETIQALRAHIFNWTIWPDFSELPSAQAPVLMFESMLPGAFFSVGQRHVHMLPVDHIVPAAGYLLEHAGKSLAFSGDTGANDVLWTSLNSRPSLDYLFVDTAFPDRQVWLSKLAKHYCPQTLIPDLAKLKHRPKIYLTHLKPGEEQSILAEVNAAAPGLVIGPLVSGEIFQL